MTPVRYRNGRSDDRPRWVPTVTSARPIENSRDFGVLGGPKQSIPLCSLNDAAGQFIAELHSERRRGHVSSETELHLKHVFRKLDWDTPNTPASTLAAAVGEEIDRLEREA